MRTSHSGGRTIQIFSGTPAQGANHGHGPWGPTREGGTEGAFVPGGAREGDLGGKEQVPKGALRWGGKKGMQGYQLRLGG